MAWWLLGRVTRHTNKPKRCQFTSRHCSPYLRILKAKCFDFRRASKATEDDGRIQWSIIDILWRLLSSLQIQISSKTTAQTATAAAVTRPTTPPKGFLRAGYWACVTDSACVRACVCVFVLCVFVRVYHRILGFDVMIVTGPWSEWPVCSSIQFDVSLSYTQWHTHSLTHTLWALVFSHPPHLARENRAVNKGRKRRKRKMRMNAETE